MADDARCSALIRFVTWTMREPVFSRSASLCWSEVATSRKRVDAASTAATSACASATATSSPHVTASSASATLDFPTARVASLSSSPFSSSRRDSASVMASSAAVARSSAWSRDERSSSSSRSRVAWSPLPSDPPRADFRSVLPCA